MNQLDTENDHTDRPTRPHRLERPVADRWAAGVAQGLATDWGIPVWVVRLTFVILTAVGGLGLLLYGLGWLFIPREGEAEPLVSGWMDQVRDRQAWLGAVLVAVAAIIVLTSLNIVEDELIWAGALLVLGFVLYRGDLDGLVSRTPTAPASQHIDVDMAEASEPEALPSELDAEPAYLTDEADAVPPEPSPPPHPPPPREPSYLGRLTLGALLVTLGIMVAVDLSGVTNPTSRHYFAAPLLVIGIGLLVGTFIGRSRGLIVLGVLLAPLALGASLLDIRFDRDFGDIDVFAATPADLEPAYRVEGGEIYLDLRRLELDGETVAIAASVGGGRIEVALPPDYQVEVDSHARLGQLDILGRTSNGFNLDRLATRQGSNGTIRLDLDAGIGQVEVRDSSEFFDSAGPGGLVTVINPSSVADLRPSYFLPSGTLELDLRGLSPLAVDSTIELEAGVGRGDVIVLLPPWLGADITARSRLGVLDLLGRQIAGENLVDEVSVVGDGRGRLNLGLLTEQGSVVVVQP